MPFLTIPALVAWTSSDIPERDLREYAGRHVPGTSAEEAKARGVIVQVVNNKGNMAKHHVFVLTECARFCALRGYACRCAWALCH